jgi:uncharacterized protein (DUF362 family)
MDRREFIKRQAQGALWLTAAASALPMMAGIAWGADTPDIAVIKGPSVTATRAAVELLGGMKAFVKPGARVLVKPNMSFAREPAAGTNTSPEVVEAVVSMCVDAGAEQVLVVDHTLSTPETCLERSGIRRAVASVERTRVQAVNHGSLYQEVTIEGGETLSSNRFLRDALECDTLIALPTAKSHSSTGVSLSMKGMMGLVWSRGSMHWKGLDSGVVDLCLVLKADLTIIDASRVLSTNGPGGPGLVLHPQTIIASTDMVAADAYAVSAFEWYGRRFEPRQVRHIVDAHRRGLGRMDLENLNIRTLTL